MIRSSIEETVPCPLRAAALSAPDATALRGPGFEWSYAALDGRVSATTRRLRDLGFRGGERLGVYLQKGPDSAVIMLACLRAGVVFVPLNLRVPASSLPPLLKTAGCECLVSDDADARRRAGESSGVRALEPGSVVVERGESEGGPSGEISIPLARPATVVFTSGSTGRAKAALHAFGTHYFSALGSNENIKLAPGDRWLHSLPMFHVGGLSIFFRSLLAGATVVLARSGTPIGRVIPESGATHVSLVATQLRRLLDGEGGDLERVEAILLGGSGIPQSLLDEAFERGLPVHTSYGLTETASQVTTTPPGATREDLRTSGRTLPHRELKISEDGEILVRGRALFLGYTDGDEFSRPFDTDGWFHTKDIGSLDEEGRLRVSGRRDNLFISGGENVQPEEVEEELRRLEGVEDAVVVPVSDAEFGFRPVAFVRGGASSERLRAALEASLPKFAVPIAFHDWPEDAPGGMKTDRAFFRERASTLH